MARQLVTYRDLDVWQKSVELVVNVYTLTKTFPDSERFGLIPQMQRAAVSIPANIAEGYGRAHRREYVQHLSIAKGSLAELETHLIISGKLKYVTRSQCRDIWKLAQDIGKMLAKLIAALSGTSEKGPKP